ncbi:hypothetical protein [Sphingomonas sp.]|jgi:hypothetical protein|uniref:hypothetical protein n=1 Tax=Sphingomonas sp. TaxID=28214 RepID=UPI002ED937F8
MKTRLARALATLATTAFLTISTAAAAAPNPAASLSVAKSARAGTTTAGKSRLGGALGGATLINIGILAALSVLVLTVVADDDGDDSPDSN